MWLLWNSLEKRQCSAKLLGKIEAVFSWLQVKDSSRGWCRVAWELRKYRGVWEKQAES